VNAITWFWRSSRELDDWCVFSVILHRPALYIWPDSKPVDQVWGSNLIHAAFIEMDTLRLPFFAHWWGCQPGECHPGNVAYSDVFDYPLTIPETWRYLTGVRATLEEVARLCGQPGGRLIEGRPVTCAARRGRLSISVAAEAWQNHSGGKLYVMGAGWRACLVRMVAVTGALAMDNEDEARLDFLVVATWPPVALPGLAMLLVRLAAGYGDQLCPNYFISEKALVFPSRTLYTAHELMQMTPVYGLEVYWEMRRLNAWAEEYLPNVAGLPRPRLPVFEHPAWTWLRSVVEAVLSTRPGEWVEVWERRRKIRKLEAQRRPDSEADFGPDWCKGHFGGYGGRSLAAYAERVQNLSGANYRSPGNPQGLGQ
jgi:hypothetical protein